MGEETKISWASSTWNPWWACHKISPGCAYCYMDRWAERSGRDSEKITASKRATFYAPLHWKEPRVIFTCSLSDFFIEEADAWRSEAWAVINTTPRHTYLILTKRIERARDHLPRGFKQPWPWPNVRLGVSAENQYWLDKRVPELLKIPAAGYFLSAEPLLGPLDLGAHLPWPQVPLGNQQFLHTVIVGGESGGPEYRRLVEKKFSWGGPYDNGLIYQPKPRALIWVRSIREQCEAAGVKFILKQFGGPTPESGGNLLDGKEYGGYPL